LTDLAKSLMFPSMEFYKLFLYPFHIGNQRLILAGLISQEGYQKPTESTFAFFTVFLILFLLLVIHLPI
jgi:hypothetical protein